MNYRPSKGFILTVLPLGALVVSLGFGILPELEEFEARPIPGEITFRKAKPEASHTTLVSAWKSPSAGWSMEWFEESCENLMRWDYNPWKRNSCGFGDHFAKSAKSNDPMEQAKIRELRRLADALHQKLILRFPELDVAMRSIPDDQNGFLKWLDLLDRIKAANPETVPGIDFPKELDDYFNHNGTWNASTAKAWLGQNQSLVDEIRAIGRLPEQSVNGIPIERWGWMAGRFGKNCEEIMTLDALVAAEQGNVAAALDAVRAARGLADHLGEVETPSVLAVTIQNLMRINLENHVLHDIIPAFPAGQVDPAAWENALNPTLSSPADFARVVKSDWHVMNRYYLLPPLLDAEDPKTPADGGELLDYFARSFLEPVRLVETASIQDMPALQFPPAADNSHLSRSSRQLAEILDRGWVASRDGWDAAQSRFAMTQAAFAIMKGQPIPQDPIYGQNYIWDPSTRTLSPPAGEAFVRMQLKPVKVPGR